MEVLAVVGGIAAISQLIELVGNIGCALAELVDEVRHVPEELRRHQVALRSIRAKLQVLERLCATLPRDSALSQDLWKELRSSLLHLQKDTQVVTHSFHPYSIQQRTVSSFRGKLRYKICDQKALASSIKHLRASEENLERIENIVHL